jgi:hypothetical protein
MREGTRSRRLHRSFARRWGTRGLGSLERLRGPLPVLESAGRRRRVLGRATFRGRLRRSASSECRRPGRPPAVRGVVPGSADGRWSQDQRLRVDGDQDSRTCPRVVTSCKSRRATSVPGAHAANTAAGEWDLARREEPPRGGPTLRTKQRRDSSRTGIAPGEESKNRSVRAARRWKAVRIGPACDLHGHA